MTTLTFERALRSEVTTLQATFPDLAERLERAQAVLQDGRFFPEEDGHTATVASKDGTTSYTVNGSCQCKASQHRSEVCYHRLALRVYQKVCDRLMAEAGGRWTVDLAPETLPQAACEVPAIMSTTLTIEGRQVEVKLCDTDDARLLARLTTLLQQFPVPVLATQGPAEGWCAPHGVQMKWNPGKDGTPGWWSHKTAAGQWCKGKAVRRG